MIFIQNLRLLKKEKIQIVLGRKKNILRMCSEGQNKKNKPIC